MTDRELLELAAKASGFVNWTWRGESLFVETGHSRGNTGYHWNPLTDDGDALRLAVKLGMTIHSPDDYDKKAIVRFSDDESEEDRYVPICVVETSNGDPYAATRRAIVRTAAEIGKKIIDSLI